MKKVLIVSPSITKSFGGMVTVVRQILDSNSLNASFNISTFYTYVDGSAFKRVFYSATKCLEYVVKKPWKSQDLVHFHMASRMSTSRAMFMSKPLIKHKIPYLVHVHGADFDEYYSSLKSKKQAKVVSFLKKAKAVIVLSEYWKKRLSSLMGIDNLVVVENCIDADYYKSFISSSENTNPRFLFLGRICERKGAWDVFEAINKLVLEGYSFSFVFAGDGENEKLSNLISINNLKKYAKVVGWANQQMKEQLLSSSDILVLPSYHEGLPMSILESMASGKVIVSSYAGSIPEVVKNSVNGYLINAGNIEELTQAMKKCFDLEANVRISASNIELVKRYFDITIFEKKIYEIYDAQE